MPYLYLTLLLTLFSCAEMTAQAIPDSPAKALNIAFEKGNLMTALSGLEWRPGLNLAAAQLTVGQTISLNVTLRKDADYVFLASGPTEQADVDLYLRDTTGKLLAEDLEQDGTPVIEFKPSASGTYQLQLHLAAGDAPESFVALSLLRRSGSQVSEQEYRSVSTGFFAAAAELTSPETGARWQQQAGEWCLFGYSLRKQSGVSLSGIHALAGQIFFAAAGLKPSEINLYLANENGEIIAETERSQPFPLLQYTSPSDSVLDLRLETKNSKPHKLVLVGVFKK
jgi:hypothetical protein